MARRPFNQATGGRRLLGALAAGLLAFATLTLDVRAESGPMNTPTPQAAPPAAAPCHSAAQDREIENLKGKIQRLKDRPHGPSTERKLSALESRLRQLEEGC